MKRNEFAIEMRSKSKPENIHACDEILSCGAFTYHVCRDFPKWPAQFAGYQVCGTYCDDRYIYATTRCRACPIAVFDMEGNFVKAMGAQLPIGRAHGVSLDEKGRILLADDGIHVVYCLDHDGNEVARVGHLNEPSDTGFDQTIKGHLAYLSVKRRGEPFNKPTRMVQAPNKRYYASDGYGNAAVHCFDENFNLLFSWGAPGTGDGEFSIVHSLAVDCRNRVLVADRDNDRLQVFDVDGRYLTQLSGLLYPCDVVADTQYIYVAENDGRISVFDLEFKLVAQIGWWSSAYRGHSIALDSQGNLYLGLLHGNFNLIKLERRQATL